MLLLFQVICPAWLLGVQNSFLMAFFFFKLEASDTAKLQNNCQKYGQDFAHDRVT